MSEKETSNITRLEHANRNLSNIFETVSRHFQENIFENSLDSTTEEERRAEQIPQAIANAVIEEFGAIDTLIYPKSGSDIYDPLTYKPKKIVAFDLQGLRLDQNETEITTAGVDQFISQKLKQSWIPAHETTNEGRLTHPASSIINFVIGLMQHGIILEDIQIVSIESLPDIPTTIYDDNPPAVTKIMINSANGPVEYVCYSGITISNIPEIQASQKIEKFITKEVEGQNNLILSLAGLERGAVDIFQYVPDNTILVSDNGMDGSELAVLVAQRGKSLPFFHSDGHLNPKLTEIQESLNSQAPRYSYGYVDDIRLLTIGRFKTNL